MWFVDETIVSLNGSPVVGHTEKDSKESNPRGQKKKKIEDRLVVTAYHQFDH